MISSLQEVLILLVTFAKSQFCKNKHNRSWLSSIHKHILVTVWFYLILCTRVFCCVRGKLNETFNISLNTRQWSVSLFVLCVLKEIIPASEQHNKSVVWAGRRLATHTTSCDTDYELKWYYGLSSVYLICVVWYQYYYGWRCCL